MAAAEIGLAGMDPMVYMKSQSPGNRGAMEAIAAAARQVRERDMHNLAVRIANAVGEMLGGGG